MWKINQQFSIFNLCVCGEIYEKQAFSLIVFLLPKTVHNMVLPYFHKFNPHHYYEKPQIFFYFLQKQLLTYFLAKTQIYR